MINIIPLTFDELYIWKILKTLLKMKDTSLFTLDNGTFVMVFIFGAVIIGLIAAVFIMMNSDKKKKEN